MTTAAQALLDRLASTNTKDAEEIAKLTSALSSIKGAVNAAQSGIPVGQQSLITASTAAGIAEQLPVALLAVQLADNTALQTSVLSEIISVFNGVYGDGAIPPTTQLSGLAAALAVAVTADRNAAKTTERQQLLTAANTALTGNAVDTGLGHDTALTALPAAITAKVAASVTAGQTTERASILAAANTALSSNSISTSLTNAQAIVQLPAAINAAAAAAASALEAEIVAALTPLIVAAENNAEALAAIVGDDD
jgi:hypothetical protein